MICNDKCKLSTKGVFKTFTYLVFHIYLLLDLNICYALPIVSNDKANQILISPYFMM